MADEARQAAEDKINDFLWGPEDADEAQPAQEPDTDELEGADDAPEEDDTEDAEAQDDEVEASEEEEFVEVEFEGEILEAPKKIAEALMRQSDYTRKTQEVAEQRKAIETRQGEVEQLQKQYEFAQEVQPELLKVQQLDAQIEQARQYMRDNIDSFSGTEIEKIRIAIDDSQRERDEIVRGVQDKTQQFQQAQEQSRQELLKKGTEVLRSRIKGWGEEHQRQVRDFALQSGFSEQEVNNVIDPRQVEVLWKAAQYDKLKQGATPAVQKVSKAPGIRPKSRNPMPDETKRKLNIRKTLKSNKPDRVKADVLGQHIAERFKM